MITAKDPLLDRVLAIVREMAGVMEVEPTANLQELGFDSMRKLDLLAVLEEQLEVSLTEDLLSEFTTPQRVASIVRELSV